MPEYVYMCLNRPAMYGTVPEGFTAREHSESVYGVVVYDHPLTLEERYRFQLRLVAPVFTPVKGLRVRFILRGRLFEDALDEPHEKLDYVWYTETEGLVALCDMEVIEKS